MYGKSEALGILFYKNHESILTPNSLPSGASFSAEKKVKIIAMGTIFDTLVSLRGRRYLVTCSLFRYIILDISPFFESDALHLERLLN